MKPFVFIVTAAQAWVLVGAQALAAPPPNTADAAKHFDRGLTLVDDEDWSGALIEFERAYELDPNYRVLFDIGQCRYQLHDYAGALRAFQRYLADGGEAVPGTRRAKVLADIEVLKGRVASVRISSTCVGAEVSVDDVAVGVTPLVSPITVSAGTHRITLRPPSGPAVTREMAVVGEEQAELTLDPAPFPVPIAGLARTTAVPSPDATPSPTAAPSLLPAWFALGLGAAGAAAGAYFGVAAIDDKNALDAQCANNACPSSSGALLSRAQHEAIGSTIGFAVGAAGMVAGGLYFVLTRSAHPSRVPATGLLISPGLLGGRWSF